MNTMRHEGYEARIEFDGEDNIFFGRLLGIRDIITFHADTVADLRDAFHEAVADYLDTCAEMGKEPQKPYSGRFMLRVDPSTHHEVSLAAARAGKSLNQWAEEAMRQAVENPARFSKIATSQKDESPTTASKKMWRSTKSGKIVSKASAQTGKYKQRA